MQVAPERPDRTTILAFAALVVVAGVAPVAVKISIRELPPFFGAGLRFGAAALIFLVIVLVRRIPLPRGRALLGALLYGVLGFGAFFALAYWALLTVPAGVGGVIMASVPLFTFLLALIQGVEKFRVRGLIGGAIAIGGITVLLQVPAAADAPITSFLAIIGASIAAAESSVIVKKFPPTHPVATNGVAMATGTVLLLIVSGLSNEPWRLPTGAVTWFWFVELVFLGSIGLFLLYLFVLKRWTASGASYQFVLMPIVTVLLAAAIAGESLHIGVLVGGAIVLVGVYIGALSGPKTAPSLPAASGHEALQQRCSHV